MSGDSEKRKQQIKELSKLFALMSTNDLSRMAKKCQRIPEAARVTLAKSTYGTSGNLDEARKHLLELTIRAAWFTADEDNRKPTTPDQLAVSVWRHIISERQRTNKTIKPLLAEARRADWYLGSAGKNQLDKLCINGCGDVRDGRSDYCHQRCKSSFDKWIKEQDLQSTSLEKNLGLKRSKFRKALLK